MLNPLNKNIFENDMNRIKKENKNKKRLIIKSTTVVYSSDSSNKKKNNNKRRSLSQIILPNYERSTYENETDFRNISIQKINESNAQSNCNSFNISSTVQKMNEKKLINERLTYHNNIKNTKISKELSWRGNVISLEKVLIEKVRNMKEDSIKGIYDLKKVILIQSYYRRHFCRKNLYNKLIGFYKTIAACQKLNNILFTYIQKLFFKVINSINKFRKHKYFISIKEYKLLMELHNKNIFDVKDLIKYFSTLFKQFNINIHNYNKNNTKNNQKNIENNNNKSQDNNVYNKNDSLSLSDEISHELNIMTNNSFNTINSIYK